MLFPFFDVCFLYFCKTSCILQQMKQHSRHREVTFSEYAFRVLAVLASIALLVVFIPRSGSVQFEYSIGKPWYGSSIIAEETFPLLKSDSLLNAERMNSRRHYKPIYELTSELGTTQINKFISDYNSKLSDNVPQSYKEYLVEKLAEIYENGIVSAEDYESLKKDKCQAITISVKNEGRTQEKKNLYSPKTAYEYILNCADSADLHRNVLQDCNISKYIVVNLSYDEKRSESLYESIERSISKYRGEILAGQEIVHRGQIVDGNTYLALRSLETFNKNVQRKSQTERLTQVAGQALYVTLVIVCLLCFFLQFRSTYLEKNSTIMFVVVMTLVFPLITYALTKQGISTHIAFVVPYCIVPIFVHVFLDSRTAFITHLCCVMLCSIAVPYHFEFFVTQFIAGMVAIYSMKQLTQRSELFKTVIFVTLASLLCYLCFDMTNMVFFQSGGFDRTPYYLILANGVLLLISYLLLFPFERIFKFTSNVTLIELSNTNNEILRHLSEEASGTFQHSMQVANLAAEVANKIGANSQLVRTGALYHDIGKLHNPVYFTENQSGNNPHDELTRVHSARLIISHVEEGLALAEKYQLPTVIREFIATHHGTSKTKYFYVSYKNEHPDEVFDESPFTYPGPNPNTLEQAILMMADAIEAASRSLKEYTEENINELVEHIIDAQVSEGFFNDCPITFESISEAKKVFKEKLKTIYHTRISYPELQGNV